MLTEAQVQALRSATPGCERVLHLDNAGMALPSEGTLQRVVRHLEREAHAGGYRAAWEVNDELEQVYVEAAALLGGQPSEVAILDSATRAWDTVIAALPWRPGDRVVVGTNEYGSNMLALLQRVRLAGIEVVVVPEDAHGQIDLGALEDELRAGVRLVALTHVATNSGLVQPAAAVGALCTAYDTPYLLDACQSVGQLPVDVSAIGCTMLAATGRKYLRGPRGTGLLWVRGDWLDRLEPHVLDARGATWTASQEMTVRPDARRFELWERSIAGVLGLRVALHELNTVGIEGVSERLCGLAASLRTGLEGLGTATVHDRGVDRCGIVTFTMDGRDSQVVRGWLRGEAVNLSVSDREMTRLDMEARGLASVLRASVHAYNTEAEIRRFLELLGGLPR